VLTLTLCVPIAINSFFELLYLMLKVKMKGLYIYEFGVNNRYLCNHNLLKVSILLTQKH